MRKTKESWDKEKIQTWESAPAEENTPEQQPEGANSPEQTSAEKLTPGRKILLGALLLLLFLLNFFWPGIEKVLGSRNNENRNLAPKPVFSAANYSSFPAEYTIYLNDHLPFRNALVTLASAVDYYVFRRPSDEQVVVGKEDWLFYAKKDDGDPMGDYLGKNLFTQAELEAIAENCRAQQELLSSLGKEFVIFIGPNKERGYPEYMPEYYGEPAEEYRAAQVYEYLKRHTDLRVVYPLEELEEAKKHVAENLYYKTDTHWNLLGGYVGVRALMKELGVKMPALWEEGMQVVYKEAFAGDLAGLLNLGDALKATDRKYEVTGYDTHGRELLEWETLEMIRYRAPGADPRRFYMIRDSFATSMAPHIGSCFSECYLRQVKTYTGADLMAADPDVVVYETVERYVDRLGTFSLVTGQAR